MIVATILTRQDVDYIKKYYTVEFDQQQAISTVGGRDDSARFAKGEKEFQPMYMIKQVPADPKLLVSVLPSAHVGR